MTVSTGTTVVVGVSNDSTNEPNEETAKPTAVGSINLPTAIVTEIVPVAVAAVI